ncbi:MAG TPA: hypothetical protein VFA70_01765, partial [Dehalococcoidia bacterium]|nr:hypothetical protein [Dehalococcoidia bacterium]
MTAYPARKNRATLHSTAPERERAYLVAVETKSGSAWTAERSLDELALLADTAGAEVVGRSVQR